MVNKASSLMPKTFFSLQVSLLYMNLNFLLSTSAIVHTCVLLHDAATHSCLGCKLVEKECAEKTNTYLLKFIKNMIRKASLTQS